VTFIYFNAMGFAAQGIKYFAHFAGPVRFPHPAANVAIILFMLPIETACLSVLYPSPYVFMATCLPANR
jgi:hypothetical protein